VVFSCGLTDCDANLDLGGGLSMDFVLVPNGTFTMGSPTTEVGRQSDEVQHEVTLSNEFYVQTTEVTQGMFVQLMGYEAYAGQNAGHGFGSDYPAFNVSWNMAAACANAATQRENLVHGSTLQECYSCSGSGTSVVCSQSMNPYQCDGYRLLTEAEWEYAARAEPTTAYWSPNGGGDLPAGFTNTTNILTDDFDLNLYAWNMMISSGQYSTIEVATLLPNDYGLYDMTGSLWEWTQDRYASYPSGPLTDPAHTTSGSYRVFRGGGYTDTPSYLRSADRYYNYQDARQANVGFRLARQP
jgi:formylglycine-generating enzyme required for sulfatase activity